ncbi:hypothetical protein D8S78_03115 [Natrialba swarupiae]|nr:hypothetical protein [Natrialba swarupiae]
MISSVVMIASVSHVRDVPTRSRRVPADFVGDSDWGSPSAVYSSTGSSLSILPSAARMCC